MQDSSSRMACPKCGFEQLPAAECVRCGVVIAKYLAHQRQAQDRAEQTDHGQGPARASTFGSGGGDPVLQGAMKRLLQGEGSGPKPIPGARPGGPQAPGAHARSGSTGQLRTLPAQEGLGERLVAKGKALLAVIAAALVSSKTGGGHLPPPRR